MTEPRPIGPPPPVWEARNGTPVSALHLRPLEEQLAIPPILAEILARRGYHEPVSAEGFLNPTLSQLQDPSLMADMDRAVQLLTGALQQGDIIFLHGDYDADGISATALLATFLEEASGRVRTFLPEREQDGYGLSRRGIQAAVDAGARLLVTLDCGTSDGEALQQARALGLTSLVVDHHPPHGPLPSAAAAVLNPAREDCGFAGGNLSATGVAYYLIIALRRHLRERGWWEGSGREQPNLKRYLDLVTLGTVADLVPLTGQNRVLVTHGLTELGRRNRPGLHALCSVAGIGGEVTIHDVSFKLAPRINAAGRLASPTLGYQLLAAPSTEQAIPLARLLDGQNNQRRTLQDRTEEEAFSVVELGRLAERSVLVVARDGWHAGIVGIVASRLTERYYLPAVVIALQDGIGRGSARSVEGLDIGAAIQSCHEHLLRGGGHPQAAGVTIQAEALERFSAALAAKVSEALDGRRPVPRLRYDAEVKLTQVDDELAESIERMAPFGVGNPEPVLVARGLRLIDRRILKGQHLQCLLEDKGVVRQAIGFGLADRAPVEQARVEVAFTLKQDWFRGERTLRLNLKDIREERRTES